MLATSVPPHVFADLCNALITALKLEVHNGLVRVRSANSERPKQKTPSEEIAEMKDMLARLEEQNGFTDWYPGTVAPERSGVYNLGPHPHRGWAQFAYYDKSNDWWLQEWYSIEGAREQIHTRVRAFKCRPYERTRDDYSWRGIKELQI